MGIGRGGYIDGAEVVGAATLNDLALDADAIGGIVNLEFKDAPSRRFLNATLGGYYGDLRDGEGVQAGLRLARDQLPLSGPTETTTGSADPQALGQLTGALNSVMWVLLETS